MLKQIKEEKNIPLSGNQVLNLVDQKAKLIKYGDLRFYGDIETVLSPYGSVFLLYETKPGYGHWCALTINNGVIRFADPYGKPLDSQLDYISPAMRTQLHEDVPYLTHLLKGHRVEYNKTDFQKMDKNVKSCGRWCAIFILFKDLSLSQIKYLFKNGDSDSIVTWLTMDR